MIEPQPSALHRTLGPELGAVFGDLHRSHGVEFRFGETVPRCSRRGPGGPRESAPWSRHSGTVLPADVVVVGIGVIAERRAGQAAGLEVSSGVVTDAALRTSDPDIYAAGDVANSFHPLLGRHVRVEHWANALQRRPGRREVHARPGRVLRPGAVLLQRPVRPRHGVLRPAVARHATTRSSTAATSPRREFIAFWLSGGSLVAGMNVNVWDVTDDIQSLIRSARVLDPARLANPAVPLSEV